MVNRLFGLSQKDELELAILAARAADIEIVGPEYLCDSKRGRRIVAERIGTASQWCVCVREKKHAVEMVTVTWFDGGIQKSDGTIWNAEKHRTDIFVGHELKTLRNKCQTDA